MKRLLLLALCALVALNAEARTIYVDASRPNNSGNGLSARKAKKTIQAAINIAKAGDTILVKPGAYAPIQTKNKRIKIKAAKGASKTSIVRAGSKASALASLGKTWNYTYVGTGMSSGEIAGKTYKANSAPFAKGRSSSLSGFAIDAGGTVRGYLLGVSGGTLKSCVVQGFGNAEALEWGAPVYNAKLTACTLRNNRFIGSGMGVASDSLLDRCKIVGNFGGDGSDAEFASTPVVSRSKLANCLVADNTAYGWNAFDDCTAVNCTIVDNRHNFKNSVSTCHFAEWTTFANCILLDNKSRSTSADWDDDGNMIVVHSGWKTHNGDVKKAKNVYKNTDTTNKDPKFTSAYKPKKGSYCIDSGKLTTKQKSLVGSKDLAGRKRIRGKAIDRGCFEY